MNSFAGTHHWLDVVETQLAEQVKLTNGNDQAIIYVKIADLRTILQLARKGLPEKPQGFFEKITVKAKAAPAPFEAPKEPRKEGNEYLNGILGLLKED